MNEDNNQRGFSVSIHHDEVIERLERIKEGSWFKRLCLRDKLAFITALDLVKWERDKNNMKKQEQSLRKKIIEESIS